MTLNAGEPPNSNSKDLASDKTVSLLVSKLVSELQSRSQDGQLHHADVVLICEFAKKQCLQKYPSVKFDFLDQAATACSVEFVDRKQRRRAIWGWLLFVVGSTLLVSGAVYAANFGFIVETERGYGLIRRLVRSGLRVFWGSSSDGRSSDTALNFDLVAVIAVGIACLVPGVWMLRRRVIGGHECAIVVSKLLLDIRKIESRQ